MNSRRRLLGIITIFCGVSLVIINWKNFQSHLIRKAESNQDEWDLEEDLEDEEMACKLPVMDPWDPMIIPYLEPNLDGFKCRIVQPYFTYVDQYNYLRRNESEIAAYERSTNDVVHCIYQTFERGNTKDDDSVQFDTEHKLRKNSPVAIKKDFVRVNCTFNGRTVYRNVHHLVSNKSKSFGKESDTQLSVMLFLMDSTSWSMFQRTLPKFYQLITKELNFFSLQGFNKVGDSTFPNMLPLLTGKRAWNGDKDMPDEFNVDYHKVQFDSFPLIWYNYSRKGYVTYFVEDTPQFAFLNHLLNGFGKKPTDHSYRPFWLQLVRTTEITEPSSFNCFGNFPKPYVHMDIINRVENQYKNQLKFGFTFFNQLSHDTESELSKADELFTQYFRKWFSEGHFNRSLVIVGSDHGHRFSPMRATLIGQLEERLPFFSLKFPNWFLRRYPRLATALDKNQQRLTTHFDIYETLVDVLNGNFHGNQRNLGSRGLSLLYKIPANRTCKIAGIPQHYCACTEALSINVDNPAVIGAAKFLVDYINELLRYPLIH